MKSGATLGKGVYFADAATKAMQYCRTCGPGKSGLLLLCQVALGNMLKMNNSYHTCQEKFKKDNCFDSAMAQGRRVPLEKDWVTRGDYDVPCGKLSEGRRDAGLTFTEYVVSNTDQINLMFLV